MKDNKVYSPGMHYYQVNQSMQELQANIEKLRNRGISFYLDAAVFLASTTKSEYSEKITPSFYASSNGILSLYLIPIVNADSKIGFVDQKCNIVVEPTYDAIKGTFSRKDSIVAVCKGKKWNIIDINGVELLQYWENKDIIPSKDSRMISINSSSTKAIQNVDDPHSRISIGGREISHVGGFRYGFAIIHRNNLHGLIDEKGNVVLEAVYKDMCDMYNYPIPTVRVRKTEKDSWVIINLNELRK